MVSEEGEGYLFSQPVKIDSAVEVWMDSVDKMAQETLKRLTKEGVYYHGKMEKEKWLKSHLGMIVIVGS